MSDVVAPDPKADDAAKAAKQPVRASVRWGGYLIVLAVLIGGGFLLGWRPLRPAVIPGWLWWFFTGGYGAAFWATAVVLGAGMTLDAADLMLARRRRLLAYATIVLSVVGLAGLSVWSYQHDHKLVSLMAALMATVGPLARRLFPGLPRARARMRKRP